MNRVADQARNLATACALALLAGCGDGGSAARRSMALSDCRLPKLSLAAQCGTLEVPENRAAPDGRKIAIAVAMLPANTLDPKPDPLFILAGGPGQAASHLGPFAAQLTGVRKDRDIILVDPRGTGRSSPLDCAALKPQDSLATALDIDPAENAAACARELAARGVDVRQYTTEAWVADLDAVRAAMGYDRINLWGGSYGTRVALEFLRRHPDRVRSVVLDGVAPPSMRIPLDGWPSRDAALTALLEACKAAATCRAAHPDLAATLASIGEVLGTTGREVTYTDPRTGESRRIRITFDHVLAALQPFTYAPELRALLPEVLARTAAGDYGPLVATLDLVTGDLALQLNTALHYSVTCTEDVSRVSSADAEHVLANVRTAALARRALVVCDVWPKGVAPAEAATPVTSDVPVLILSGGLDPVTPPSNGALVAKTLRNSRHIVARGYGHIVSMHACGPQLIAAFIGDPTFATLPHDCIAHFEGSVAPALWPDRLGARE